MAGPNFQHVRNRFRLRADGIGDARAKRPVEPMMLPVPGLLHFHMNDLAKGKLAERIGTFRPERTECHSLAHGPKISHQNGSPWPADFFSRGFTIWIS